MTGYIIVGADCKQITLTRSGLYYVITISGESAANFGMISYNEANSLCLDVLKHLCRESFKNI